MRFPKARTARPPPACDQDALIAAVAAVAAVVAVAAVAAVAAANPRPIVFLHTANPVPMPWRDKVSAILAVWYPGEEAAAGLPAILFGNVAPTAKLPVIFPADETSGPTDRPVR